MAGSDASRLTLRTRLKRLLLTRLVRPLRQGNLDPGYAARGTAAGVFWAFTPLIPVQMYLLGLTWLLARPFPALNFHPLIALAWIWVTNWLTIIPVYFIFYITGQMLLGRWDDLVGYAGFAADWRVLAEQADGFLATAKAAAGLIIREQGLALGIGCLPYAIGGAWLGHTWSHRLLVRRAQRRRRNPPIPAKPSPTPADGA